MNINTFKEIGNETINLMYSKTDEQKELHIRKLLEKFPNLNPIILMVLTK